MILTRYILKEHLRPFLYSLIVITFILIMDYIITVIDMIISKGLDIFTVLELFFYNMAWMVALSVPMAVLVATLMAFGRLSADNEITAIKTSGTNLYTIIRPVVVVACLIAGLLVVFNDRILPNFNLQVKNLLGDIRRKKPAAQIKPGIFITDFPGYSILIGQVDQKTSAIREITIYEHQDRQRPLTIRAEHGLLRFSDRGDVLTLELFNGEIHEINDRNPREYQRVKFKRHLLNIYDVGSQLERTYSSQRRDREMDIAMMRNEVKQYGQKVAANRKQIQSLVENEVFQILNQKKTGYRLRKITSQLVRYNSLVQQDIKQMDRYQVEIHKKYSIPVACIIFVLIGAPLGVMARRGGIAIGAGISLGFFLIYWAFLIGGEDLADRGLVSPFWAMWSANLVLGLAGIYLIRSTVKETKFIRWEALARFNPFRARRQLKGLNGNGRSA